MNPSNPKLTIPVAARERYDAVMALVEPFCREHLTEEYLDHCRELAATLARKRPSPLLGGKVAVWAAAIVRTIGWVNFLDDPTQTPHLKLPEIDRAFGVSSGTAQGKAKAIRDLLRIHQFDRHWTLPSRLGQNPLVWMVQMTNGMIVDIRSLPREVQEDAARRGIIPYVPSSTEAPPEP